MSEKLRELYIKSSLGFGVVFAYALILVILIFFAELDHPDPMYALYIYSIGGVINIFASIILIRYGSINAKDITWHITRLALAHVSSLVALFFAMIYLFGQSVVN